MRRDDVASTSFRRRVPIRFLINQCQIITFLILKYDIIENSRIELRGLVLPVQMGGLLGGPKGMLAPPLKLLGGAWPPLFLRLWAYWRATNLPPTCFLCWYIDWLGYLHADQMFRTTAEAKAEGLDPVEHVLPPPPLQIFFSGRSKVVLLLWFLSGYLLFCPYVYGLQQYSFLKTAAQYAFLFSSVLQFKL